ncbi:TetR family transcriptional regulator [Sphingomonas sp. PAMC 26605]|uniref:TetR family transcriptional regulator n=1 Tax=Sphingomonas sp. PAMC 26605 TaxID=1112214 RepID=UPI0009D969AC|nr:TetR family transcriptional regulator [Sphingomonas sp. PAMC 26605]
MTILDASPRRRRRHPDELRDEALAAARRLLLADGPSAVTLQAVARALNMAHGNITHHFGSAAKLQAVLADALIAELLAAVSTGTRRLRSGEIDEADLVDLVFDTFEESGVGRLIGWLAAQRSVQLDTLYHRFAQASRDLSGARDDGAILTDEALSPVIATVVIAALGASLIGPGMSAALGLPVAFMRAQATADFVRQRQAAATHRGE